jgi:hypothetical protein
MAAIRARAIGGAPRRKSTAVGKASTSSGMGISHGVPGGRRSTSGPRPGSRYVKSERVHPPPPGPTKPSNQPPRPQPGAFQKAKADKAARAAAAATPRSPKATPGPRTRPSRADVPSHMTHESGFHRHELLPQRVASGINAQRVANNRRSSDKYHSPSSLKNILKVKRPGKSRITRVARRLNNGNLNGFGGIGGMGGVGGLGLHGLHHHKGRKGKHGAIPKIPGGGAYNPTKSKHKPLFKPVKPLPVRKIKMSPASKQKKPIQDVKLTLGTAQTTRPKFARNRYGP